MIEEAAKKSDLVWLRAAGPQQRSQAVWHVWHEGAVYVLTDSGTGNPNPNTPFTSKLLKLTPKQ